MIGLLLVVVLVALIGWLLWKIVGTGAFLA